LQQNELHLNNVPKSNNNDSTSLISQILNIV